MRVRPHLLVAVPLAGLLLGACEPLGNDPPPPRLPDAGGLTPDAGTSTPCWEKRQLAENVQNLAFTFDAQGVGHFAFNQGSQVYLGSTRPGEVPTPVATLVGSVADLAVDVHGQRHLGLAYGSMSLHAHERHGSWTHTVLAPGYAPEKLKLDASGAAHLLLRRKLSSGDRLAHATNRSGSWAITELTAYKPNRDVDLELDTQGNPHIAFGSEFDRSGFHYVTHASGDWVYEWLSAYQYTPQDIVLALDAEDRPHLLSRQGFSAYHTTRRKEVWQHSQVGFVEGMPLDVKVDAAGNLTALLAQSQYDMLLYARLPSSGEPWTARPITSLSQSSGSSFLQARVFGLAGSGGERIGYWHAVFDDSRKRTGDLVMYAQPCR